MNIKEFEIWLTNTLMNIGIVGYIISCFLIIIESLIPILPVSVFTTLLFYKFGYIFGFIISYICSVLGSLLSFYLYSIFKDSFLNYMYRKNKYRTNKIINKINNIKFTNLCLLISLPFTPQFLVNISCSLANMNKKKYILSVLIGKIFLIIFWGFIGTSLLNSIKNPINLIYICLLLSICFILSKLISKKEGIE